MLWSVRTLIVLGAMALALGVGSPASAQRIKLDLGTSHPGGGTFEIGTAMGKVIADNSGGRLEVSATLSGGSTANIRFLQKKDSRTPFRMSMVTTPAVFWGQNAMPPFKEKQDVVMLTSLYPQVVLYAAHKATGIAKWADLVGKRFVVGARGGSIYQETENALRHSGIFDKVKREHFTNPQNAAAIKDQRVDAGFFFTVGFTPAPSYMELAQTMEGKLNFFGPDEATLKKMVEGSPGVVRVVWPANSAPGQASDVATWGQMWALVTNSKMAEDVAYLTVKTLLDYHAQIEKYHPIGKVMGPKFALEGTKRLTFHPGAVRYFKEKGMM